MKNWPQFENLLKLGYHDAAGMNMDEFKKYFPDNGGESDLLIVAERCVGIRKQCELLDIKNNAGTFNEHEDVVQTPRSFLYNISGADDGSLTIGLPDDESLLKFGKENRRTCTTVEILAIYREFYHPKRNKIGELKFIDAYGSRIRGESITTIFFNTNIRPFTIQLTTYAEIVRRSKHSGIASCSAEKPNCPV